MRNLFSIVLLTLIMTTAFAKEAPSEEALIRATLKEQFPELMVDKIVASPISSLYQVTAGAAVVYITKDGRYIVSGDIIDLKNRQNNLTENARKSARLNALKNISEKDMVIFSPKNPQYTVTVFTDVDCGYCRKFQSEISEINAKGIAVRYLAFPRTGPNSPTFEKMVKVWCAKDKQKALAEAKADKPIDSSACTNNPVMQELQLGLMVGVNGTPSMIFEDGSLFPGYLPADKLLEVAKQIHEQMKNPAKT